MVHLIELLLVHGSHWTWEVILVLAGHTLSHRLRWNSRVALIVTGGHWSRLVWDCLCASLLQRACLFLGGFRAERLLGDYALLMQCVIDCLGGADTLSVRISTLLLLVHVLAQARLFFGWKLLLIDLRLADDVLGGTLRVILLFAAMDSCGGSVALDILGSLVDATAWTPTASLTIGSLILLHDVLEGLLIEVPARFVLICTLVDILRPASRMWNHQVLLVPRPWYLWLHRKIVRLVLLLAEP